MTPEQVERYRRKSRAVVTAWVSLFGAPPSLRALARAMAVAEHETRLGDAAGWTGEHNWGGLHKRSLSAVEQSFLASRGLYATGGAAALATARALLPHAPDEALHIDTSPASGPYFVWFWAFPDDAAAARKFLQVLVVQRPRVREALERDDVREVAAAMYDTGYYEGFHKGDRDANIHDYARRLAALEPLIAAALATPASPGAPPVAHAAGPYQRTAFAPAPDPALPPFPPPAPTTFPPPPFFYPQPAAAPVARVEPAAAAAGSMGAVLVLAGLLAAGVAIAKSGAR